MKIKISSTLDCPAEVAWEKVLLSETLRFVAFPLVSLRPSREAFPKSWEEGQAYYCESYLFGIFPFGKRKIFFERLDRDTFEVQTRESDFLIKKWDHHISINPMEGNHCLYTDEVDIEAGSLTGLVLLWTRWFFRHRQRRWRKLLLISNS